MRISRWPVRLITAAIAVFLITSCGGSEADFRRLCAIAGISIDGIDYLAIGEDRGDVNFSPDEGINFMSGETDTNSGISDFSAGLSYDLGIGKNGWLGLRAGFRYERFETGTNEDLNDAISFGDLTYTVGSNGHFGKFNGSEYLSARVGVTLQLPDLNKIACANQDRCCVVGSGGAIYMTVDGGQNWNRHESGTTEDLNSIFLLNGRAWAVGNNGALTYTLDLQNWNLHPNTGATGRLNDLYFFNEREGLIVGDNVYSTTDGGMTLNEEFARGAARSFKKMIVGLRDRVNEFYLVGNQNSLVKGFQVQGAYTFNELDYGGVAGGGSTENDDTGSDDTGSGDNNVGDDDDSGSDGLVGDDDDDAPPPKFLPCFCDDGFGPVGQNFVCADTGKNPTNCS